MLDYSDEARAGEIEREAFEIAYKDMIKFMNLDKGQISLIVGYNETNDLKREFMERLNVDIEVDCDIVFVESMINNESLAEMNLGINVDTLDYTQEIKDQITDLFHIKQKYMAKMFQTLELDLTGQCDSFCNQLSFIKMINMGESVMINSIHGFLSKKLLEFLINYKSHERPIFLTRHGQSEYNLKDLIGGDAYLAPDGRKYAAALTKFFKTQME